MDLRDLRRAAVRGWWWIVGCTLVGAGAGLAYVEVTPAQYDATATVVLLANGPQSIPDAQSGASTTIQLSETVATIIDSPSLLESAATDEVTAQHLVDMTTVTPRTLTSTLDIVVRADDPQLSATLANAAAAAARDEIPQLLGGTGEDGDLPLTIEILAAASAPDTPAFPLTKGVLVITTSLGVAIGITVAVALEARRHGREQRSAPTSAGPEPKPEPKPRARRAPKNGRASATPAEEPGGDKPHSP
ncbi:YveK family protein [Demequina sp.]|uniref:YveK family protein n=1 Tax=Demequina sp. TaxID=2050685 RepID=UPI003A879871